MADALYRKLLDQAIAPCGILDRDGKLLYANEAFRSLLDLTKGSIKGYDFLSFVHPEDVDTAGRSLSEAFLRAGVAHRATFRMGQPDRGWHTLEASCVSVSDEDSNSILLMSSQDVTLCVKAQQLLKEREIQLDLVQRDAHKSEARYRILIDNVSEGVIMAGADGRVLVCNPGAGEILGIPREDVLQQNVFEADWNFVNKDGQRLANDLYPLTRALQTRKPETGQLLGIRNPDGSMTWISMDAAPIMQSEPDIPFAAVATFHDVTELLQRERQLSRSRQELRDLTAQLHRTQEEERARIAREVHDVLGQATTALRLDIHWLKENAPPDNKAFKERVGKTLELVEDTINTVRRISHELRPGVLDHLGLAAALEWMAEQYEERSELKFNMVESTGTILDGMDSDLATALFRIFQEAVTNILRHAHASTVEVRLYFSGGRLILHIADDGKGIEVSDIENSASLGILNMRERVLPWNGVVSISGSPDQGTHVEVSVPYP